MTFNRVEDSGKRQEFPTGSVRDTQAGKGRFDLVPGYALFRLAQHYENGAVKYGDRNWERGQPLSRYLSSAIRHLVEYGMGMRKEDHLAAAAWNAFAIIWTEEQIRLGKLPQELDDMNPPSPSIDYVIGIDFAVDGKAMERIMFKPRSLWQRFLARIGM